MIFFFFCLREYLKRRRCRLEFLRTCLSCRKFKIVFEWMSKNIQKCGKNTWIKDIQDSDGSNTILSNIKRTQTCSSIGDQTRTPYFWLRTNEHCTLNLIRLSLDLLNYSSNWLKHHFLEHRSNSNMFIYW